MDLLLAKWSCMFELICAATRLKPNTVARHVRAYCRRARSPRFCIDPHRSAEEAIVGVGNQAANQIDSTEGVETEQRYLWPPFFISLSKVEH